MRRQATDCEKYIYILRASLLSTNWDNILLIKFKFRHVFSVSFTKHVILHRHALEGEHSEGRDFHLFAR